MSKQISQSNRFEITANPTYICGESDPDSNYFFFAYKISIKNIGPEAAQLVSRHWLITDSLGNTEEVKGPGVVGLQPRINPGQIFEYDSACPMHTSSGSMRGSFQMVDNEGNKFEIQVPEFYLISPTALH